MTNEKNIDRFYLTFEKFIILVLTFTLMLATTYATIIFITLLLKTILTVEPIWSVVVNESAAGIGDSIARLQSGLYEIFGGFLLILLGVELINTVRSFSKNSYIKMESIISIAIIATARHLITLDYHHSEGIVIFAIGFVMLSLIYGFYLLKKLASSQ